MSHQPSDEVHGDANFWINSQSKASKERRIVVTGNAKGPNRQLSPGLGPCELYYTVDWAFLFVQKLAWDFLYFGMPSKTGPQTPKTQKEYQKITLQKPRAENTAKNTVKTQKNKQTQNPTTLIVLRNPRKQIRIQRTE